MGGKLWIRQVSVSKTLVLTIKQLTLKILENNLIVLFQMLIAAFLVPTMVCTTAFFINFIAMGYHASRAIPFGTMVRIQDLNKSFRANKHTSKKIFLQLIICIVSYGTMFVISFSGGCCINLHFCDFTAHFGRNRLGSKYGRYS